MPNYRVLFSFHKEADGRSIYLGNITNAEDPVRAVAAAWEEVRSRTLHDENLNPETDLLYHLSVELIQRPPRLGTSEWA